MGNFATLLPLILLLLIMYFLLIRPQKKREKEVNAMRNSIQVGDEVITIGGICGKVVKTKEETLVIQVGADKVKFEMMRWSISKVVNAKDAPKAKAEAAEEEAPKKKMPKRLGKKEEAAEEPAVNEGPAAEETPVVEEVVEEAAAEEK